MKTRDGLNLQEKEVMLKALASARRLNILCLIFEHERICAKELAAKLGLSQPDVSYHLSKLTQTGILERKKQGVRHCYDINYQLLKEMGIEPKTLLTKPKEVS